MKTKIFHLQIIPIADIVCHEEYDNSRAKPLVEQLKKEKYLANPIIVAPFESKKYLQLDGMNRLWAFKILGFKTILAQVIDYNDQDVVELSSWCHLFHVDKGKFFHCTDGMDYISVKQGEMENIGHRYIKEEGFGRLCTVVSKNCDVYLIFSGGSLVEKIQRLNKFVSCYIDSIARDVLPSNPNHGSITLLFAEHPETNMMIIFPTFTRHQIIKVIKKGGLFPAGVTRHIIKRRCLNINIPLSFFDKKNSVTTQNKRLEAFLLARPYRVYEEPTVYFE